MLDATTERIPNRIGVLTTWLPRIAVGLVFVTVGSSKFRDPMWVRLFGQIGLGQWFRYLTGVMQIGGGLLVLIPRLALMAVIMLACTMAGAAIAWLTVLHAPANAPIPGALLVILIAIGWSEYNRPRG
jgi:putative oxidoreductase